MLHMQAVTKVYRTELVETHALRSLDLHVREGEFVAVTGPSGSGKTTFLNIAGLLETFTGGTYLLDGEDVSALSDDARSKLRNRKIGFIFQSFNLIPDLNLFDNVDVPLRYRGMSAAERRQRIEEALTKVGLGSRMKHFPAELSGGQPAPWPAARACCWPTSPPETSTRRWRVACWRCWRRSTPPAPPSSWSPTTRNWPRARSATCTSSTAWRRT